MSSAFGSIAATSINAFFFKESAGVVLPNTLQVNIRKPGTYASQSDVTGGQIPSGTLVNSYLVHANPLTNGVSRYRPYPNQFITFSLEEYEIASTLLINTDATLGSPTTLYSTLPQRGLELLPQSSDQIILSTDAHTVTFSLYDPTTSLDEFRIITKIVYPTPQLPAR